MILTFSGDLRKKQNQYLFYGNKLAFWLKLYISNYPDSLDGPSITDKGYTSDKSLNLNSIMPIQNSYGVGVRYVKTD